MTDQIMPSDEKTHLTKPAVTVPIEGLTRASANDSALANPIDQTWFAEVKRAQQPDYKTAGIGLVIALGYEGISQAGIVFANHATHFGPIGDGLLIGVTTALGLGIIGLTGRKIRAKRHAAKALEYAAEEVTRDRLRSWLVNRYQITMAVGDLDTLAERLTAFWGGGITFRDINHKAYMLEQYDGRLRITAGLPNQLESHQPDAPQHVALRHTIKLPESITRGETQVRDYIRKLGQIQLSIEQQHALDRGLADLTEALNSANELQGLGMLDDARITHITGILDSLTAELCQVLADASQSIYDRLLVQERYIRDRQTTDSIQLSQE